MSSVFKFALILLAAALLAFGARAMYVNSLNRQQAAPVPDVRILVAAADLPQGLLLRDGDLAWRAVAKGAVPTGALQERDAKATVSGALLRHRLAADAVLKDADLIRPDAPGFLAAALRPGMRAVSVPINDVSGNAGLIQPGDYVDIILTQRFGPGNRASGQARVASETVVERARVIAVGSTFQREADATKAQAPTRARTVTIEVAPRAAEAVTVAAELGSLSMALRSFATTDRNDDHAAQGASVVAWEGRPQANWQGPVWGSDVSRVLDDREPDAPLGTKAESVRRIVILRGQNKQEQELSVHAQ